MVNFIDDLTRRVWVNLINKKSDVFDIFKKLKSLAYGQSCNLLKIIATDGGDEYVSDEFSGYYEGEGIIHEVTPHYTPQYNDIVERGKKKIMNIMRCMLRSRGLPSYLLLLGFSEEKNTREISNNEN